MANGRTPYPYQWGPLLRENATASLEFVGWLLRGAPGPWWGQCRRRRRRDVLDG